MKKKLISFVVALIILLGLFAFTGCEFGNSTKPDYNADATVVAPESITDESVVVEEGVTYYTSNKLSLWLEVNGEFFKLNYFSLDGNKRIYDNLYLYKDDYFYMLPDDMSDFYASLSDSTDTEYAEEEKEQGYDIQLNVKKSGIYKLIFDVDTLKFDMEYKAEIQTPVYRTIKNCSIYTFATEWVEMSVNPKDENEFVINNFNVGAGEIVAFYSNIHTSNYKITLDPSCKNTLCAGEGKASWVNVGGNYNIYINRKTYVVRLELLNPDTATYSCVYYDGAEFITLTPFEQDVPYIFHKQIVVEKSDSLPKFHTSKYKTYNLTLKDDGLFTSTEKNYYFKSAGTYNLIINLKTFEISAELMPE